MAGNEDFWDKLMTEFGNSFGEKGKEWIKTTILQYALIESDAEGISRSGDTTSNQAEQMNFSLEEARSMPPITMIKHVSLKYFEKATSSLMAAFNYLHISASIFAFLRLYP